MEIRYSSEEYEAIVSRFIDDSDWVVNLDLSIFLRYLFDELLKRNLGKEFFSSYIEALEDARIINDVDEDAFFREGWRSFTNQDDIKTFILSMEGLFDFKKEIIQQYGSNRRRCPISNDLRKKIYARDGYECRNCGSGYDLVIDHIYPHSLGGTDLEDNLQTLCRRCNSQKGSKVVKV